MEKLSYDKLNKKIKDNYNNGNACQFVLIDENDKERRLTQVIDDEIKNKNIGIFKVMLSDDITIFEYELINGINGSKTDNTLVIKDNKPILKMEKEELNKLIIPYEKEKFWLYDENVNLVSSISFETIANTSNVNISNRIPKEDKTYDKSYTFYSNDIGIIALSIDQEIHLIIENGFINGIEAANKLISEVSNKIDRKLDELLGIENIKEYQIKRKKQG